jgi:hypothetical protein
MYARCALIQLCDLEGNVSISDSEDRYSFAALTLGWFSENFENAFSHFPFIGARDKLAELQKRKSVFRSVIESFSKRVKITSLLSLVTEHVLGVKLPKNNEPNKLAEDLIKKLDEERYKKTVELFLSEIQENCKKEKRYFNSVSVYTAAGAALFSAKQAALQNEIVVVSGQLVHKDAIAQYNDKMAQTVSNLPGEWLLADFPPHGMVSRNKSFEGGAIGLEIEKEFAELFKNYLPYDVEFGWYPYARVTGFYKEPGYGKSLPTLSVIMTEFRRPKQYAKQGREIFSLLDEDLKDPNYLKDKSSLLLASYALPLVAKGANIDNFVASPDEKSILQRYLQRGGGELPKGLRGWYDKVV